MASKRGRVHDVLLDTTPGDCEPLWRADLRDVEPGVTLSFTFGSDKVVCSVRRLSIAPPFETNRRAHLSFPRSQVKSAFGHRLLVAIPLHEATVEIISSGLRDPLDGQLVQRAALVYLPLVPIVVDGSAHLLYPKMIPFRAREDSAIWGTMAATLLDNDRKILPACPLFPVDQLTVAALPIHALSAGFHVLTEEALDAATRASRKRKHDDDNDDDDDDDDDDDESM
jgi:hypothetical protein